VDAFEITLRLAAALAVGAIIGLNRDLQGKPAGVRTHSLVCVGSAAIVVAEILSGGDAEGISRVMQGILAGVGFLGAGVIMRRHDPQRVEGLTTAATIWIAAVLGAASGAGHYLLVGIASVVTLVVLLVGGPLEEAFARIAGGRKPPE
jgi:putative Mg2+ transporter-C (MgtC) family protein